MSEKKKAQALAHDVYTTLLNLKKIYEELLSTENSKQEALIKREVKNLAQLISCQEDLLRKSRQQEILLSQNLAELAKVTGEKNLLLSQITYVPEISSSLREKIQELRLKLLDLGSTLRNVAQANETMLQDNLEIFRSLVEKLSRQTETTYTNINPPGRTNNRSRPVLLNTAG